MRSAGVLASIVAFFLSPMVTNAATTTVDSRSAAMSQDLSANSVVFTAGYHTPGDGGGAIFKNTGVGPFIADGASFADSSGTRWQYTPDSHGIQARQFGAKCNWNEGNDGNHNWSDYDTAAYDDKGPIQNAIDFAARAFASGEDVGGGAGSHVWLPKGSCKLNSQLRVKNGVILAGEGALSSILVMPQYFEGATHFVVLGSLDPGPTELASFGARIEELGLWSINANASYDVAMVYSRKTQHTGGISRVKIMAGNRVGVYMSQGAGGASLYIMDDVEVFNVGSFGGGNPNPGMILNYYGSSISNLRNIVVQGPGSDTTGSNQTSGPNHIGIRIDSGVVNIEGFHTENIATGISVNMINPVGDGGITRLHSLTGGERCTHLVLVQGFVAPGSTVVGMASKNGCTNTLTFGVGGSTHVTQKIIAETIF